MTQDWFHVMPYDRRHPLTYKYNVTHKDWGSFYDHYLQDLLMSQCLTRGNHKNTTLKTHLKASQFDRILLNLASMQRKKINCILIQTLWILLPQLATSLCWLAVLLQWEGDCENEMQTDSKIKDFSLK